MKGATMEHMLDPNRTKVPNNDGVTTWFCKCGFATFNASTLYEHILTTPATYADTDSIHIAGTGRFLLSELFGEDPIKRMEGRGVPCLECGALVTDLMTHTEWHNKVADL